MGQRLLQRPSYGCLCGKASSARRLPHRRRGKLGLWYHALVGLVAQDDRLENTRTIATTPDLRALLRPKQGLAHRQYLLVRRRVPNRAAHIDPLGLRVGKRHLRAADVQRHVGVGRNQVLVLARAELVGGGTEVANPCRLGRVLLSTRSLLESLEDNRKRFQRRSCGLPCCRRRCRCCRSIPLPSRTSARCQRPERTRPHCHQRTPPATPDGRRGCPEPSWSGRGSSAHCHLRLDQVQNRLDPAQIRSGMVLCQRGSFSSASTVA
eukprot:COSAG04_NODE_871_length_9717_cov_4.356831_7_plen_265_part_00